MKEFAIYIKGTFICSIVAKNEENAKQTFCDLHIQSKEFKGRLFENQIWQEVPNCMDGSKFVN